MSSSPEKLEEIEARGDLSEAILDSIRNSHEACRSLHENFPNVELNARQEAWTKTAAENGFALAKLELSSGTNSSLSPEEFRSLLYEALSSTDDNKYLEEQAYRFVLRYLSKHKEWSNFDHEAWSMMYCKSSAACDYQEYYDKHLAVNYHSHEIDSLIDRQKELEMAIARKNWEELSL